MRSRASSRSGPTLRVAALHWTTFYVHTHHSLPWDAKDSIARRMMAPALRDIVRVQCHGDERRACDLIEEIVAAPIFGVTLTHRYAEFWLWVEAGKPARVPYASGASDLRDVKRCIAANVAGQAA